MNVFDSLHFEPPATKILHMIMSPRSVKAWHVLLWILLGNSTSAGTGPKISGFELNRALKFGLR